jgi:uncharacterized protein (TIGR02117 family)
VSRKLVYLVDHGWHTGLVIGANDFTAADQPAPLDGFRYLEVGWGDGDYYPARRGTVSLALRASFRSRWSVIQVVGFDGDAAEMFPHSKILEVSVSPQGFTALARYIDATFALDDEGRRIVVAPAAYGAGFFYLARGRYRLADNSNNWAARGLAIAGCPIDVEASVTAGGLLHQAVRFARVVRPGVFVRTSEQTNARCR